MIVSAILALVLRVFVSFLTEGYAFDLSCFFTWSSEALNNFSALYDGHIFCDYPPLYIYVLYLLGAVGRAVPFLSEKVLFAFPAFAADIGLGYILYKVSGNKMLFLLYVFCPAVIINSAVWGQIDGIFAFFSAIAILALYKENYTLSSILFCLSILLKPQGLVFLPVCLFVFIEKVACDKKYIKTLVHCVLAFVATAVIIAFPFSDFRPISFLFRVYSATLGQYPYASLNAYNFYSLIAANFANIEPYGWIGVLGGLVSLAGGAYLFFRKKKDVFYVSATILLLAFTFVTKMHERYLLPAAALYLLSYGVCKSKKTLFLFFSVSFHSFANVFLIYIGYSPYAAEAALGLLAVCTAIYSVNGENNESIQTQQKQNKIKTGL